MPATKKNTVEETWTYIGRRATASDKLAAVWLDGEGEERLFIGSKLGGRAIGATYTVEVERKEDEGLTVYGSPTFLEAAAGDDDRVRDWEARDRAAYTGDLVRKAEAKLKREGQHFGELTLDELRDKTRRLPRPQRVALIAQVLAWIE